MKNEHHSSYLIVKIFITNMFSLYIPEKEKKVTVIELI